MDTSKYAVLVRPLSKEDGGGYVAQVPDLPGCMSDGKTIAEAIENVEDAIPSWIKTAQEFGDPVPQPSRAENFSGKWVIRVPKSLHMKLAQQAAVEGVSLNALAIALLAEGLGERTRGANRLGNKARRR
ncbi:MAG: type II toxin-antitoxin system HicB family antitoxin [Pseudomonadota bacterium]